MPGAGLDQVPVLLRLDTASFAGSSIVRSGVDLLCGNLHPSPLPRAQGNELAQLDPIMARLKGGEGRLCLKITGGDVAVEISKELHESVGISFGMASRISRVSAHLWAHERGILDQAAIGFFSAADPKDVGLLLVPG